MKFLWKPPLPPKVCLKWLEDRTRNTSSGKKGLEGLHGNLYNSQGIVNTVERKDLVRLENDVFVVIDSQTMFLRSSLTFDIV